MGSGDSPLAVARFGAIALGQKQVRRPGYLKGDEQR